MKTLMDLSVKGLLKQTASDQPVPGGGSICALAAAFAAGLVEMVAGLTIGKKGYEDHLTAMKTMLDSAAGLREKTIRSVDEDAVAYDAVFQSFKLPQKTDAQKSARKNAIQEGLKRAAQVPLDVAKCGWQILCLTENAIEKGNRNTITDGAVAAMMARSAIFGALLNVKINLQSIQDPEWVAQISTQVATLEKKTTEKETSILDQVVL